MTVCARRLHDFRQATHLSQRVITLSAKRHFGMSKEAL